MRTFGSLISTVVGRLIASWLVFVYSMKSVTDVYFIFLLSILVQLSLFLSLLNLRFDEISAIICSRSSLASLFFSPLQSS